MTTDDHTEAERSGDGLTRRQALGYGGALAGGAAAVALATAAPADAAAASLAQRSISLAQANRLVNAAIAYVRDTQGVPPMYVLVVDVCGDEKASKRMDGNGPASVALVPAKARTALAFRSATLAFGAGQTDPGRIASFVAAGFSLLGGGRPVFEDGVLIGAIAVGGGSPEQDDQVAGAALEAL